MAANILARLAYRIDACSISEPSKGAPPTSLEASSARLGSARLARASLLIHPNLPDYPDYPNSPNSPDSSDSNQLDPMPASDEPQNSNTPRWQTDAKAEGLSQPSILPNTLTQSGDQVNNEARSELWASRAHRLFGLVLIIQLIVDVQLFTSHSWKSIEFHH